MWYIFSFLCILSCHAATLNKQKYYPLVKEVKMEIRDGAVLSRIALENNTIWTVYGMDLRNILRVGVPIGVFPTFPWSEDKTVILCDAQNKPLYYAFFFLEDLNFCPTVQQNQRICTQEEGWFSSAKYDAVYTLSDGSSFTLENDNYSLKQGEHVYAFYDSFLSQWVLFSLERGGEIIDGKNTYGGLMYFYVKPHDAQ